VTDAAAQKADIAGRVAARHDVKKAGNMPAFFHIMTRWNPPCDGRPGARQSLI